MPYRNGTFSEEKQRNALNGANFPINFDCIVKSEVGRKYTDSFPSGWIDLTELGEGNGTRSVVASFIFFGFVVIIIIFIYGVQLIVRVPCNQTLFFKGKPQQQ